jgi:hypothetical protein
VLEVEGEGGYCEGGERSLREGGGRGLVLIFLGWRAVEGDGRKRTTVMTTWIQRLVRNQCARVLGGGGMPGYSRATWAATSSVLRSPP